MFGKDLLEPGSGAIVVTIATNVAIQNSVFRVGISDREGSEALTASFVSVPDASEPKRGEAAFVLGFDRDRFHVNRFPYALMHLGADENLAAGGSVTQA